MKVRISPGGNSGIQYRGEMRPDIGFDIVDGYQCDIVANQPRYHGMLYEERGRRNHHQHWVNGHPTADLIDLDASARALEGALAVQVHVGPVMKVQFKDFKIKHLPDSLPLQTAAEHSIPPGSPGVSPQGKLPEDWESPIYGEQ